MVEFFSMEKVQELHVFFLFLSRHHHHEDTLTVHQTVPWLVSWERECGECDG